MNGSQCKILTEKAVATCACVCIFNVWKKKVFQDLEAHIEWKEAVCEEAAFYLNNICFQTRWSYNVYSVRASWPFLQQFIDLTSQLTPAPLCSHLNPKRMRVTETGIRHYYIKLLHTRQNYFNDLQLNDWWGEKMLQTARIIIVSPRNCGWL